MGIKKRWRCIAGSSLLALIGFFALPVCADSSTKHWDVPHPGDYTLRYYTEGPNDMGGTVRLSVGEREFFVPHDATRPSAQSMYLLSHWKVKDGEKVLDIGTGAGVQAIFAAEKASWVVATDIQRSAVDTTIFNVKHNGFGNKIEVRQGDLFEPIRAGERFDVILFNINYPFAPGTEDMWEVHQRFFAEVSNYLKPGGRVYYQIGMLDNIPAVHEMARDNHLRIVSVRMDAALAVNLEPIVFVLFRDQDIKTGSGASDLDY